jgi:hypothetical protein
MPQVDNRTLSASVISERMDPKIDFDERSISKTDEIGGAMQNWRPPLAVSVAQVVFAILAADTEVFHPHY